MKQNPDKLQLKVRAPYFRELLETITYLHSKKSYTPHFLPTLLILKIICHRITIYLCWMPLLLLKIQFNIIMQGPTRCALYTYDDLLIRLLSACTREGILHIRLFFSSLS
jgi:hypothetical protein